MLIDVTMPQLGESVAEGTLSKWRVQEGDRIEKDQTLAEIATDKADSELPSPVAGRIAKIVVREGETVAVKALLCQIEEGAGGAARPSSSPPSSIGFSQPPAPAPDERGLTRSATGVALASPGTRREALEQGVDLAGLQGSGERGRITREDVLRASAQVTPEGPPFRTDRSWSTMVAAPPHTEPPMSSRVQPSASPPPRVPQAAAPQIAQIVNAGGGFVPPIPGVGFGAFKVPPYRPAEGDKVIPFTRRRRITADHMTYSKVVSPHVVTVAEVDLHKTSALREQHKDRYKKEGHALTMLAFVTVAAAKALREHPELNARVLDDAYVVLRDIHIGVAVDSPEGLVVPVVRRADELGVRGIVRVIDDLAKRAKTGKITADDLSGATFSITNPGIKGNLFGGAIINQPNAAILRMGEIQKRVVVVEGDGEDHIAIHPVMYMALSYDHRIVDGVLANSFLWRVTELLEQGDFLV
jgi:pyruvate/2-oxoglutarate dehydrogenase complex dihydrolipoamide acyltransferase (E2) component